MTNLLLMGFSEAMIKTMTVVGIVGLGIFIAGVIIFLFVIDDDLD